MITKKILLALNQSLLLIEQLVNIDMRDRFKSISAVFSVAFIAIYCGGETFAATEKMKISTYLDNHSGIVVNCKKISREKEYPVYECPPSFTVSGNEVTTISYDQQGSRLGRDGICGAVALANTMANFCGTQAYTPLGIDADINSDDGGTKVRDYEVQLNKLMQAKFCAETAGFYFEPEIVKIRRMVGFNTISLQAGVTPTKLANDSTILPAIVTLDMNNGTFGHATTVVAVLNDSDGCTVIHNTWGKQYHTPCDKFREVAKNMVRLTWIPYSFHMMLTGNPLGAVCVKGKSCDWWGKGIMWEHSDKLRDLGPALSEERKRNIAKLVSPVIVHRVETVETKDGCSKDTEEQVWRPCVERLR